MKKRAWILALACVMTGGSMTGCGFMLGGMMSGSVNGTYVNINGNTPQNDLFKTDVDAGIETVLAEAAEPGMEHTVDYVTLDGGEFVLKGNGDHWSLTEYSGDYSKKGDKILFEYRNLTITSDGFVELSVDIDDEDSEDRRTAAMIEKMSLMNETGTFYHACRPSIFTLDRYVEYNMYPYFNMRHNYNREENEAVILEHHGDFLCTETYGFELDGRYRKGSDFEITYNPYDAFLDDAYSPYYLDEWDEEELDDRIYLFYVYYFGQETYNKNSDTTIKFSEGLWEWYNEEGELINNGAYQESEDYPGLIMMTITEDSALAPVDGESDRFSNSEVIWKQYSSIMPLLFYIDGGEIYYPGYVKAE